MLLRVSGGWRIGFALFFAFAAISPFATAQSAATGTTTSTGPQVSAKTDLEQSRGGSAGAEVSYVNGQLRIQASDSTLADILMKVAIVTGIKIDIPPEARSERMPLIKFGPGPSREILAALLRDTAFNFLIQASDTDPDKLQSVLIMPEDKKGSVPGRGDAVQSPFGRTPPVGRQQEATANENLAAAVNEPARQETASSPPSGQNEPNSPGEPAPPQSGQLNASSLPGVATSTDAPRPGAMNPPAVLSQQNITQQLQQMYQQRMQMVPHAGSASTPFSSNGGNN
jgi:hypothetical protein